MVSIDKWLEVINHGRRPLLMVPQASLEIITMLICISIVHSRIFTLYSISVRVGVSVFGSDPNLYADAV